MRCKRFNTALNLTELNWHGLVFCELTNGQAHSRTH